MRCASTSEISKVQTSNGTVESGSWVSLQRVGYGIHLHSYDKPYDRSSLHFMNKKTAIELLNLLNTLINEIDTIEFKAHKVAIRL